MCAHTHVPTYMKPCMLHIHEKKKKQKKCTGNEKEKVKEKEGYRKEIQDSKQKKEILIMVILMV